jgi:hypothetical protein
MEYEKFLEKIKSVAASETSVDPSGWTSENILWGHCVVVSLIAQDIYGGELVRASIEKHCEHPTVCSHCWNRIDGDDIDFTKEQFPDLNHKELDGEIRSRDTMLDHPDTARRYNVLKNRFDET